MPLQINPVIEKEFNKRIVIAISVISVCLTLIIFRLWYLQIFNGRIYSDLSKNNRVRIAKVPAPRGIIFARNDVKMVENIASFDLTLIPQDTPDQDDIIEKLSLLLREDKEVFLKKLLNGKNRPPFEPITLKQELPWNQMSLILSNRINLHGISIDVVPKRHYCFGSIASHLLGFLGEIDQNELRKDGYSNYSLGDLVGKDGLEKWGEKYLRGQNGGLQTEVDARGHLKKILAEIEPVPGYNLFISIDAKTQKIAEELIKDKTGAVVAMDPQNGDVLVIASSPSFNPNLFSRGIKSKDWNNLMENSFHPLLNRALQSQQPPGSIFKIVVAIAGLENDLVDPQKEIFCPGYYKLGNRTFKCWKKSGHGWVNLRSAIVESCDVYFYQLGLKVGIKNISKYAQILGFGEKTGFEIGAERNGLVPSPEWKQQKYGKQWQKGETLNTSIGQGFLLTTPIQVAATFCGIANGGVIPKPRIVLKIKGEDNTIFFQPENRKDFFLTKKTISFINEALVGVVNDPKGTGQKSKVEAILVAGKTGTAQTLSSDKLKKTDSFTPSFKDHAWFVCFAPADDPKIVVSILIEHGGHGGTVAAPIAQKIIKSYLKL